MIYKHLTDLVGNTPLLEVAGFEGQHARIALKLLADAKNDDFDLTTFRYEMINHIQKLRAFEAT